MDITQDYQAPISDNQGRKSLGRRVSFGASVHVRVFKNNIKKDDDDTTSSTASSQSSPSHPADASFSDDDPVPAAPVFNDENAYPGANRRRSSMRKSIAASEDMDMTSNSIGAFISDDQMMLNEDVDFDEEDSGFDVTQSMRENSQRPSAGGNLRTPLSQISSNPPPPEEESFTSEQSYASDGDRSEPMEFTIPLNQPLRPASQDEAWLALVKATHAGDSSMATSEDMDEVDDGGVEAIVSRDRKARHTFNFDDPSNDSVDVSFGEADDVGNQTMDLSKVMGRVSFGGDFGRPSMASSMDESEVYGDIVPATSTPRPSFAPQPNLPTIESPEPTTAPQAQVTQPMPTLGVFTAPSKSPTSIAQPPPAVFKPPSVTSPRKINVFTPRSSTKPSPAKPAPRQFSAAFAPPVARSTPKKAVENNAAESSHTVPNKRERTISAPSLVDPDRPSPAKRQAIEVNRSNKVVPFTLTSSEPSPVRSVEKPRPLSPSKRAPFQASAQPKPSSIRRPSGYFARRKSLGVGLASASQESQEDDTTSDATVAKRTVAMDSRRASVSSGPSDAWTRFDKSSALNAKGNTKPVSAQMEGQEEERTRLASSSSESSTSANPEPIEYGLEKTHPVDLSVTLEAGGFGDEVETDEEASTSTTEQPGNVGEQPPISIQRFF
ncbi:hypothetical protein BDP27DRAFT_388260 [Rhodocollybia butyracea]|uniref:Uncharacterized protein n=1 Tax=Rhodocollybia butyracea TaxID=206335 RepID=A0A9P5PZH8_9AGAR|nr:hypothetical protein BDP27DRAFT_388260 [Rhodocollybia butyracea]